MEIKTDLHLKFFLFFRQLGNSSFCCLALGVALLFYRFPADVSSVGLFFPTSNFLFFFFYLLSTILQTNTVGDHLMNIVKPLLAIKAGIFLKAMEETKNVAGRRWNLGF